MTQEKFPTGMAAPPVADLPSRCIDLILQEATSSLPRWPIGRFAARRLRPQRDALLEDLRRLRRLFADEAVMPVLARGADRTKRRQLWAYARHDHPRGGTDPPAVAHVYGAEGQAERPMQHLAGFIVVLQIDGYAGFNIGP